MKKNFYCDCKEYIFKNDQLVCKRCSRPMKTEKKKITSKGARHQAGYYNKK